MSKPSGGLFLPTPVVVTLGLAVAALLATYVFVTKVEFLNHAKAESNTTTVLEERQNNQAKDLVELKETVKAVDINVRTLMTEQGVPATKITVPKEKK